MLYSNKIFVILLVLHQECNNFRDLSLHLWATQLWFPEKHDSGDELLSTFCLNLSQQNLNLRPSAMSLLPQDCWFILSIILDINPTVQVPSKRTLSRSLAKTVSLMKESVKAKLATVDYVCATADIRSTKHRSFMGVTAHWVSCLLQICCFI